MDLEIARLRAEKLMSRYGLDGWTFGFDRAVRRAGACHYSRRQITLSRSITELNQWSDVEDTIRHEIAHALVGPRVRAHGPEWKTMAIKVGATPQRCAPDSTKTPPGKWQATCLCTGRVYHRQKTPPSWKMYWCRVCKQILVYVQVS
jgi:predicted SprT family Zn-dependent metalloprotease